MNCDASKLHGLHRQLLGQLTVAEDFQTVIRFADDLLGKQCVEIDNCAILKLVERLYIDNRVYSGEFVVEAALRQFAVQRELTALKTGAYTAAGTGVLTLVTFACGLSVTGADTATLAPCGFCRPFCGRKFMEFHRSILLYAFSTLTR